MGLSHIKDILTAFSPSLDLFAISVGDGRIKLKHDRASFNGLYMYEVAARGKKEKTEARRFVLVLGTGGGDVLALDVSAGQLKWRVSKSKRPTINSLFQLSGHLQLVSAQIDKASNIKQHVMQCDEQEDESEDEDVDEVVYGVDEDDSQIGSETDD